MSASDPINSNAPARAKEPGNALGAVGLIVTILGGAALVYDVPPDALAWPSWVAWPMALGGIVLLLAGLAREWRGPARRSALIPGLAALAVGSLVVGFAVYPTFAGPRQSSLSIPIHEWDVPQSRDSVGVLDLVVYTPRHVEAASCALLIGVERGLGRFTARELATRGVTSAVAHSADFDSQTTMRRVLDELASRSSATKCTLVAYGETPASADLLAAADDFDRAVAVSFQAASRVSAPRNAVPTLYLFGGVEPSGHEDARALHAQLGAPGRDGLPESVVRIFLGADANLMVPRDRPWMQPGRLPAGYVDMVALWAERGVTEG